MTEKRAAKKEAHALIDQLKFKLEEILGREIVGFEIDFEDGDLEVYFLEEEEVELE